MKSYCIYAMFGGDTASSLVMAVSLALFAFFMIWLLIKTIEKEKMNEKNDSLEQKKPDMLLAASILISAILVSGGWIYSASITSGSEKAAKERSAPAAVQTNYQPKSQGCGV